MIRRLGILALCIVLAVGTLHGCAEMTEQQKGAAVGVAGGALAGGLIGHLAGGKKGAITGAAAGAVVGGLVGWQVGAYRARQVKGAKETIAAAEYKPQQGILTKIEKSTASPKRLKPGDQITIQTRYQVLAPPEAGRITVQEVRTLLFNKQELKRDEKIEERPVATHTIDQEYTLPGEAAKGQYTVRITVEPLVDGKKGRDKSTIFFVVE